MLIATLTALYLLFWSSSSAPLLSNLDQTEKLIKANVENDARRERALQIVGRMKDVHKAYWTQRGTVSKSLAALLETRATQPSALEAALNPLLADSDRMRDQLVDLRFQLKSVLTASEWAAVFRPPKVAPSAGGKVKFARRRTEGWRS
ncbi:MAG TPA: hypothetical protein VMH32_05680 [Burkholderiales bacterium]|nr:hypothetical protein [Burkholderiales bacterium]